MGQKVNPIGIRLGIIQDWNSKWYSSKYYSRLLNQDINLRKYLKKKLSNAFIGKICIERPAKNAVVTIYTARPGIIIGKKGGGIENLRKDIESYLRIPVKLNIEEIKHPELDPILVSENIAQQLEQRIMFRRIMKKSINSAIKSGAKGIKICISGRLGGSEIARSECYREGRIPLHTFRANISYGFSEARTTYGMIGVKVWVFSGEIYTRKVIK
ncbi:30S ribosomal protein S3 [Candidatus Legionella polyplacis]|uniref:Small ribosomal subunit protein uS3 n=1 Tax=Candidatus Legionella polyplacis TaxID=2005262 RepID=A0ABZ2H0D0_9GAMM